jgi:hypothetical protein
MGIDEILDEKIKIEVRKAVEEIIKPLELFSTLPETSLTGEVADFLRVTADVVRNMAENGMPHAHAGRKMRFFKPMLIQWAMTGKVFECEFCGKKKKDRKPPESNNGSNIVGNVTDFSPKMRKKIATFVGK